MASDSIAYVLNRTSRAPASSATEAEGLVLSHARLCAHIVNLVCPNSSLTDDLFSAALQGITEATRGYHPSRGKFSHYASRFIRREISDTLGKLGYAVRAPEKLRRMRRRIADAEQALEARGESVTSRAVAEEAGLAPDTVLAIEFLTQDPVALDAEPELDRARPAPLACESPTPEMVALTDDDREALRDAVASSLSATEREVIIRYYGMDGEHPETLTSLCRRLGVSRQRVCQIADAARDKLRNALAQKV